MQEQAQAILADLSDAEPDGTVTVSSGALAVASPGNTQYAKVLARPVAPGSYPAFIHQSDQEFDAVPTVGVDGVLVRFADRPVATWEEARTADDEPLIEASDVIGLCFGDAETFSSDESLGEETQSTLDDVCTDDGVGEVEGKAVVVYIGEVAIEHRMYCGLDDAGELVALVGAFRYPGDDE